MRIDLHSRTTRWLPWVAGLAVALAFVHPLWADPAGTMLDRVFWYDALINVDDLASLHAGLSSGPQGRGFHDWLYGAHHFHPQPRPLVFSELMPLAALVTWPLAGEPLLAHNLLLVVAQMLNVVAGAYLARALGARPLAALLAGVALSLCAYTNFSSGRLQLMFVFPLPWAMGALVHWARDGRVRHAAQAAAAVLVCALLCLYYAVFLALLVPVAALALRLSNTRERPVRDLAVLAGSLAVAALPAVALLWPYREMRRALGIGRSIGEVAEQGGDPMLFLWADQSTVWHPLLRDVWFWDSAYFPGAVVLLGALAAVVSWVRRDPKARLVALSPTLAGLALMPLHVVPALLGLAASALLLGRLARQQRTSPVAPLLFAVAAAGFFLFLGPTPTFWKRPIGWSPYVWLYDHVPFVDGLRVARRAGLLVQMALGAAAALWLSRLQARRGIAVAAVVLAVAAAEQIPWKLGARPVVTACEDEAYRTARELGAVAVGELWPKSPGHALRSTQRFQATLCGVRTHVGLSGFDPPVVSVVMELVASLPDPSAHAALWELDMRHVVVRQARTRDGRQNLERLEEIARKTVKAGRDAVVELAPPPVEAFAPGAAPLPGERISISRVACSRPPCAPIADGVPNSRWTTRAVQQGGEQITLEIAPALVTGLVWHSRGFPGDLPRGLRVERRGEDGRWVTWAEWPALSPRVLGRVGRNARYVLPLPKEPAGALRLTQIGESARLWLSATEIEVYGEPGPAAQLSRRSASTSAP